MNWRKTRENDEGAFSSRLVAITGPNALSMTRTELNIDDYDWFFLIYGRISEKDER